MTLRSRGKGNGRLSRQASWRMLELEIRLSGEGVFCSMKSQRSSVQHAHIFPLHQRDLLTVAAISRRQAVRGDYDYTSLRHLRSHF